MIQDRDLAAPGTDRVPQGAMHIIGGGFAGDIQGGKGPCAKWPAGIGARCVRVGVV